MKTVEERLAEMEREHVRYGPGDNAYPTAEETQRVADQIIDAVKRQREKQMIRAKFQVSEITKTAYGQERAKLTAVPFNKDAPTGENSTFAKATPNGNMEMWIDNPGAQGFLKPGSYYYLDFTEAPAL